MGAELSIGDGKDTKFWLSAWIAGKPMYAIHPSLLVIVARPHAMVSEVFATGACFVGFLRLLSPEEQSSFDSLLASLHQVYLSSAQDSISWGVRTLRKISVKSAYAKLVCGPKVRSTKALWASQVPPRVRILFWQAALDRLPSASTFNNIKGQATAAALFAVRRKTPATTFFDVP